ncbi:peptidylprolyl isomerase [Saccharicrinis aurantiacus]|uniref:peptidylprolyl isomerase n=1 Tax=Saccharicrinis aurantiacus TaxID=1849719 RepID=UPI001FE2E4DA|nr:peptidylprolyl isomerase [Saccharicrinis aurantiacus]
MRNLLVIIILLLCGLSSCKQSSNNSSTISKDERSIPKGSFQKNIKGVVEVETYDHYGRLLKQGYGFYISSKTLVTNLSLVKGSFNVKVAISGSDELVPVAGYLAYDINADLVILKTHTENLRYLKLNKAIKDIPDSIKGLYRQNKKIYAPKLAIKERVVTDSLSYLNLDRALKDGIPAFTYLHHVVGITQYIKSKEGDYSRLIPISEILKLQKKQAKQPTSVYELRAKTNKIYPSYKKIKGFNIETTMGNIGIKLYNETPIFRDNFIKLVSDNFYDSLLIHRVLKNFLIQTGAADSKYASKDDLVGWQGPGYNLPTKIAKTRFHKRGAIAASKMPEERNKHNRSDGSQFYIIGGRTFTDDELNDIEKEKGFKFSSEQRHIYKTQGGAPYLDGDYVVFAEVSTGMHVVDKIAAVETDAVDRPYNDIRIKTIHIVLQ